MFHINTMTRIASAGSICSCRPCVTVVRAQTYAKDHATFVCVGVQINGRVSVLTRVGPFLLSNAPVKTRHTQHQREPVS